MTTQRPKRQFSIAWLMVLTAIIAISVGVLRFAFADEAGSFRLLSFLLAGPTAGASIGFLVGGRKWIAEGLVWGIIAAVAGLTMCRAMGL